MILDGCSHTHSEWLKSPASMAPYGRVLAAIILIVGCADQTAWIFRRRPGIRRRARTVCVTANLTVMEHMIGVDKARARCAKT